MELIKKIKEAETNAHKIIDQAGADAVKMAETERQNRQAKLEQAQKMRKIVINKAVEKADAEAQKEVQQLNNHSQQNRELLQKKASQTIDGAVAKVMEYLKG